MRLSTFFHASDLSGFMQPKECGMGVYIGNDRRIKESMQSSEDSNYERAENLHGK